MMIRNIITLTLNDLAIACKNKTIYLIFFIPCFVFFSMKFVDRTESDFSRINLGLIKNEIYSPVILKSIESSDNLFFVFYASNADEGKKWLHEKKIDGLLLRSEHEQNSLILIVLKKESLATLTIVEIFSALQKTVEKKSIPWISDIKPLHEGGIQKLALPTWILMLVLLVGFIVMPAQIAEEKEKKLLLALLQTPMREIEWLIAKLFLGMILIVIAVLLLHLLGKFNPENVVSYIGFILIGSFCFTSYGIFLGFLCRNQASARTLGVIFYLPHLMPSALSDFSKKLTIVAPFLPSYQFFEPIRSILLENGQILNLYLEFLYLITVGVITLFFSYLLMKRRWRM